MLPLSSYKLTFHGEIRNFKSLTIFCGCTARFVSDLVGNTEDRFSHNEAHLIHTFIRLLNLFFIPNKNSNNTFYKTTFVFHTCMFFVNHSCMDFFCVLIIHEFCVSLMHINFPESLRLDTFYASLMHGNFRVSFMQL